MQPNLLIIDGPSAVGKSTVVNTLLEMEPDRFAIAKRVTTRAKRNTSEDNHSYEFVSHEAFEEMVNNEELVEYKNYLFGMSYGLPRKNVLDCFQRNKNALAIINLG